MSVVAVSGRKETAFVIEQVGPASTHADRRHVDGVLVRTRPVHLVPVAPVKPCRPNSVGRRLEVHSYRSTSEPTASG